MGFKMSIFRSAAVAILVVTALAACPTGPHGPGTAPATPVGKQPAAPSESAPPRSGPPRSGPPRSGPPPAVSPPSLQVPGHAGRPYDVVSSETLLTILAFRGGPLGKAGHNHVIASHDVTGTFYIPDDVLRSTFELHIPVAQLTIDEPQLRAKEGPDFPTDVPDSAKEGTRKNMLSDALLNGAQYPDITLVSQHIAAGTPIQADVQVTVRGQTRSLKVPIVYTLENGQLTATGELAIKQTDLGLTPFSALLGALQVLDEMHVKFRIVARSAHVQGPGR
jgi:polyisoprenoid-binding protein YceI